MNLFSESGDALGIQPVIRARERVGPDFDHQSPGGSDDLLSNEILHGIPAADH
jgi:hypothetical protein